MIYLIVAGLIFLTGVALFWWRRHRQVHTEKENLLGQISEAFLRLGIRSDLLHKEQMGKLGNASGFEGALRVHSPAVDYLVLLCIDSAEKCYQMQYIISQGLPPAGFPMRQVRFSENRKPPVIGEVVSLDWSGDEVLAGVLAEDRLLNNLLIKLKNEVKLFKMWVNPSMIGGYASINSSYYLPTVESFDAVERIAAYIRLYYAGSLPVVTVPLSDSTIPLVVKEAVVLGADSLTSNQLNITSQQVDQTESFLVE